MVNVILSSGPGADALQPDSAVAAATTVVPKTNERRIEATRGFDLYFAPKCGVMCITYSFVQLLPIRSELFSCLSDHKA